MKLVSLSFLAVLLLGLVLVGCSTDSPTVSPAVDGSLSMAVDRGPGTGSFEVEAKYTYFKNYPGGKAIYLLKINPGPDFSGDAIVNASSDRFIRTHLTNTHLNAGSIMTELVLDPSWQLAHGTYYITVTVSNKSHVETVELELELMEWSVNSEEDANEARDQFIDWLAAEHPELGSFGGEEWDLYCHYPLVVIHEHYTHLSDNWEFRVSCHVTWIPEDYYTTMWLRPRGQWDPVLAAERVWDEATQGYVFVEVPLEGWNYIYGY